MLIPTVNEIELLTGEAIDAVEVVSASQYLWPVEGFTKQFADAYRQDSESIDAAFTRAREGNDQVPNMLGLARSMSERPLIALPNQMRSLEASLRACNECPVFTSLHGGEDKNYKFLDFIQHHTAKQRPHRYLVWDGNEEQCCGFSTGHEVAYWWLSWVRNFEHYCQSRLFNLKSGWWLKDPGDLCERLELDAKNYSKAPRLDSENLKELIRDESMAMLSSIGGNHWNRRAGTQSTEWLTSPARFDVDEIKVFIDHDGWPKLVRNTEPPKAFTVEQTAKQTIQQTIPPAETDEQLPFGLMKFDVPQAMKREGYKPVTIWNEDYWKLMEALMAAWPNAVPESKLKQMYVNKNDRKNAPKKLREIIDSLGLTVTKWTLMELKTRG